MPLWGRSSNAETPTPPTFNAVQQQASSPARTQSDMEMQRQIKAATYELKGITDLFNRMTTVCWEKCVAGNKFSDAELTVGELACIDRCVIKYMAAQTLIGKVLNTNFQQQQGQGQGAVAAGIPQ